MTQNLPTLLLVDHLSTFPALAQHEQDLIRRAVED